MRLLAPNLENAEFRLELFEMTHVEFLKASGAVEAMWDFMPDIPKGKSADAYASYILKMQDDGHVRAFAIFRQSDDAFAGVVTFETINRIHRRVRIANFWHPEEMRGTGVFASTQSLMIQRALDWGARRIGWAVPTTAELAIYAIERLGAQREGVLRSYVRLAGGGWADLAVYSMLREEAEMALQRLAVRSDMESSPGSIGA